jgi:hypothetical protein
MNRIIRILRRDPLRKYDLKPGQPFGESGSWVVAPDGMSLLPAPRDETAARDAMAAPVLLKAARVRNSRRKS